MGVDHVAALPDGRALSASGDSTLRLWDLASGQCLRVLEGHSSIVVHVAALPDGRAISASKDNTLRLWDLASGKCLRVLEGHSDQVSHVAALPDGRALSASEDNTLRLWDLASGQCLRVLKGHSDAVTHVAALPDGRALSASWDNTLRLWDLASGQCLRVLEGTFRCGRSRRGAARRARHLRVMGQDPAALGPRLRPMPARPQRTFRCRHTMSRRCPTGARSPLHGTKPCGSGTSATGMTLSCFTSDDSITALALTDTGGLRGRR